MACAVMLGGLAIAAESISITATPRYPWNGKVDLKFTIAGDGVEGGYADPQPGDELIAGRRLRYVQSAGDVHLNTGATPGSKNTIEMKFEWMDNPSSANECLFCARGSTITTATYTGFLIGSTWRFDYNTTVGGESDAVALQKGVPYVIRDVAGTASVNGTVVRELAPASFTVGGPLTLFSSYVGSPGNTGENYLAGKVYYLKIFGDDGTTLLHDFAPWEQNGKVGLYDLVGKKFVSASTGTLSAGQKYDTSFTAKDVAGGTNLTMKTLYKSNGTAANPAKEQLLPGTYNWVWDATADLGEGTVLDRVVVEGNTAAPVFTYSVKFNANGGTGTMANESFTYGTAKALTANSFTRAGYVFSGWATSASGAKVYSDKQSVTDLTTVAGGIVNLYAVWALGGVQLWAGGPYFAECNVGATKPEGYGYYFMWGDTVGYKRNSANNGWVSVKSGSSFSFDWNDCPTYGKSASQLRSAGYSDSVGNLAAAHDAATAYLGAPWRMPTDAEFSALRNNCDAVQTTRNGVKGWLVKGRGAYVSKSIFLPAAGFGYGTRLDYPSTYGRYWSSTPYSDDYSHDARNLIGYSDSLSRNAEYRYSAQSVRPVRNAQ